MKQRSGLICAGGVTHSSLARMPSVLATVGPVLSVSLRVARRMANALRAGQAVHDPEALRSCDTIWIAVPDKHLDRVLSPFRRALERKTIVLCDSVRDSGSIAIPAARVATLNRLEPGENFLVAEGHPDALRMLRRIAKQERAKLIELNSGSKPLFLAAMNLAGRLMLPSFSAAVENFRSAGFSRSDATRAAEMLTRGCLRAYNKAGRKAWNSAADPDLRDALERHVQHVHAENPKRGELYRAAIESALR